MEQPRNHDFESDRRLTFRLNIYPALELSAQLLVHDEIVTEAYIHDIALGGVSLLLKDSIPASIRECTAHFALPIDQSERAFELRCDVVHQTESAGQIVCGLEFLDIFDIRNRADYHALLDFLSQHIDLSREPAPWLIQAWPEIL